jgi:hypothetical protein
VKLRVSSLWATRRRKVLCLGVLAFVLAWILTATWGSANARDAVLARYVAELSWDEERIVDFDPTLWPAALEPYAPWYFVGNARAVSPFLVRLDTISAGERRGVAFRGYVLWFFGATHELAFTWGELWHYEKRASGAAHGMVGNTIVIK